MSKAAAAAPPAPAAPPNSVWPADKVARWPTERLTPHARNARTHSKTQVEQIAHAITEFGWTNPVLVDEAGVMIAGHGRVLAAQLLGLSEVPVMVAAGWSDAQKRTYLIADNQLTLNGGWDKALLKLEVADLGAMGVDLASLGFGKSELGALKEVSFLADTSSKLSGLTYSIVIRCSDEQQQGEVLAQLSAQGLNCEALIS